MAGQPPRRRRAASRARRRAAGWGSFQVSAPCGRGSPQVGGSSPPGLGTVQVSPNLKRLGLPVVCRCVGPRRGAAVFRLASTGSPLGRNPLASHAARAAPGHDAGAQQPVRCCAPASRHARACITMTRTGRPPELMTRTRRTGEAQAEAAEPTTHCYSHTLA